MQIAWRQPHTLPFNIHPWNSSNLEIVASIVNRHVNDHIVHLKKSDRNIEQLYGLGLPDFWDILLMWSVQHLANSRFFLWLGFTCSKLALEGYLSSLFGRVLDFKSRGPLFKSHLGWNGFFCTFHVSCFIWCCDLPLVNWPVGRPARAEPGRNL